MWVVLAILGGVNLGLLLELRGSMFSVRGPESAWEVFCFQGPPFNQYIVGFAVGIALLLTSIWICCSIKLRDRWRKINTGMRHFFTLASFALMWTTLGLITAWRRQISRVAHGRNNKDEEWTFGQVLTLAAWVPTLRELANIIFCQYLSIHDARKHCLTEHMDSRRRRRPRRAYVGQLPCGESPPSCWR